MTHLKVLKRDFPLIGRVFGRSWDEQGPTVAGDRLTAEGILSRSINFTASVERRFGPIVLQLHRVESKPAAGRHLVVALAHSKAGNSQRQRNDWLLASTTANMKRDLSH